MTTTVSDVTIVKAGDIHPVTWRLNADLTGVTSVELHIQSGTMAPVTLPATVTNAASGEITHNLDGTLAPGMYSLEAQATGPNGRVFTAPSNGHATLWVQAAIA